MIDKQAYKIMDDKGRVLIPAKFRAASGIEKGDFVKLSLSFGKVAVEKINIIELGNMSEEAINEYIAEAVKHLPESKIIELASYLMRVIESGIKKE